MKGKKRYRQAVAYQGGGAAFLKFNFGVKCHALMTFLTFK